MRLTLRQSIKNPSTMTHKQKVELAKKLRLARKSFDIIMEKIPKENQVDRMFDYVQLRHNRYTPTQAMNIVTGTTPTGNLQPLNLKDPAWQHAMEVTKTATTKQARDLARQKKLPAGQAMRRVMVELENLWVQKTKGEAFKGVDDFSPKKRRKVDVIPIVTDDLLKQRSKRLAKEEERQRRIRQQKMQPSFFGKLLGR